MPEGPQVARYARLQNAVLAGHRVRVDSPNGRSEEIGAQFDGRRLVRIEAVGKHLLYDFGSAGTLHIHLGRFGNFRDGAMPLPEVRGVLRLRIYTPKHWIELRGAIAIEPFELEQRRLLEARIGPNPLDPAAAPQRVFPKIAASRSPIGLLVMDQSIVAGVGNIYRSEVLFLRGVHPRTPGNAIPRTTWRAMWKDFARLMADGAIAGRIVTTAPRDRGKPVGPVRRADRFYVYHRAGLPCRRCGTPIVTAVIGNRNVYWCPQHQPEQEFVAVSGKGAT